MLVDISSVSVTIPAERRRSCKHKPLARPDGEALGAFADCSGYEGRTSDCRYRTARWARSARKNREQAGVESCRS